MDIHHDDIMKGIDQPPADIRSKSKVAHVFYAEWKIKAMLDYRVYQLSKSLMNNTFSSSKTSNYEHPFHASNDVIPYIDKICYRLPDHIRAEGGLGLHIDMNPIDRFKTHRYRPIQSFISLTDHYDSTHGGLQLIPNFHGEFIRLHSKKYAKLHQMVQTVIVRRGSVVYWDNRLPHKTCELLEVDDSREVIYFSYLPNVSYNIEYLKKQYDHIKKNILPPSFCLSDDMKIAADRNWSLDKLNNEFKRLNPHLP